MKGVREKTCVCVWRRNRIYEKQQPSAGLVVWSWLKAISIAASNGRRVRDGLGTGAGRARDGLGTVSGGGGAIGMATQRFCKVELRRRRSILVRSGVDFVAGVALSQCSFFSRFELRGRRNIFENSGVDFVAGAALSQGQVHISWQVRHFCKGRRSTVIYIFRGRCSTFVRSSAKFVVGAALLQGQFS